MHFSQGVQKADMDAVDLVNSEKFKNPTSCTREPRKIDGKCPSDILAIVSKVECGASGPGLTPGMQSSGFVGVKGPRHIGVKR